MTKDEAIKEIKCYVNNSVAFAELIGEEPDTFCEALRIAISALERDRWISVKDATPKMMGEEGYTGYLVYSNGFMQVADYVSDGYGAGEFHVDGEYEPDVVAFIPLPEPPKEAHNGE